MKFGKTFSSYQTPKYSTQYLDYKGLKQIIKEIIIQQEELYQEEHSNKENETNPQRKIRDVSNEEKNYFGNEKVRKLILQFSFKLDRNLEKIDNFYNNRFAEYSRQLQRLLDSPQFANVALLFRNGEDEGTPIGGSNTSIASFSRRSILNLEKIVLLDPHQRIDDLRDVQTVLMDLQKQFNDLNKYAQLNKRGIIKILKKFDKKVGTSQQQSYLASRVFTLPFAEDEESRNINTMINEYLEILDLKANKFQNVPPIEERKSRQYKQLQFPGSIDCCIKEDNVEDLEEEIKRIKDRTENTIPLRTFVKLLLKASLNESQKCIDYLLEIVPTLNDETDINNRNFFHHYVILMNKNPLYAKNNVVDVLSSILGKLKREQSIYLLQRDDYKRTPLHYACQYGLYDLTKVLLIYMKEWNLWPENFTSSNLKEWEDYESLVPLHLAILSGDVETLQVILDSTTCEKGVLDNLQLTHLAIKLNQECLVERLLQSNKFDVNYQEEESQETALYLACKLNCPTTVKLLLQHGVDTELKEGIFGWTPLFIAATEGYFEITKHLIDYNCKMEVFDEGGWTPMEHAVLRGHLEIAELLTIENIEEVNNPKITGATDATAETGESLPKTTDSSESSSLGASKNSKSSTNLLSFKTISKPVKSFGHKYLKENETILLITLGSSDTRRDNRGIIFKEDSQLFKKLSSNELEYALSLVISCEDDLNQTPVVFDLPFEEEIPDSISFKVPFKEDNSYIIYFDLVPTYDKVLKEEGKEDEEGKLGTEKRLRGRSIAVVNHLQTFVGDNRRSLTDLCTLPIMSTSSPFDIVGTVNFEIMLVKPFIHENVTFGRTKTYWKSLTSTRVIGHRGFGMNRKLSNSLQLGENTMESFIAASSLGAAYVEFDVQLTKDNIPVIYHDFTIAETGVDIPMHELTLEQFLELNNMDKHMKGGKSGSVFEKKRRHSLADFDIEHSNNDKNDPDYNNNNNENNGDDPTQYADIFSRNWIGDRMRLTKTFKAKQFKGNSRGHSIASSFVTLPELFKKLPPHVGFNIECKYPMIDEAEEEGIGPITIEMNHWVDTVLRHVYDNMNGRDIILSSFHPDVCIMLSLKQPSLPVLFLTEAGCMKMVDARAASLQNAIKFAHHWNLLGIVSAAKPIIKAPRLVEVIKGNGLVCVTYGVENNDPNNAQIEIDAGVDAVIVDSVLAVRRGLTKGSDQSMN
ncbi:glycerophosphocholine phosphodiesterase NDAI_0E02540 [Naumovozyma dairenensis CBS 421]|uniref:GP-PDE domain-containing protein n=1 Tax=Naumovozyma dairenensis (strain ATCC 10597 / BCRC 20456 / CBS 421 / NBRC 0211 / NRRL Y-12639) TaxID=1071378 RepID=G0WBF1_NAUDC|nr:hypothetical protein NDAI_0E02540 [Naumovozyma dairenensis CBS 421]CCD25071.1 hypothetical protein NDAI_0E02540 [Naumovozyma dairenensis CBS 421]